MQGPWYSAIVRLFPPEHRASFETEMLRTLEEAAGNHVSHTGFARVAFVVNEVVGLLRTLEVEWCARWADPNGYLTALSEVCWVSDDTSSASAIQAQLSFVLNGMEHAIAHHDFPRARQFAFRESELRDKLHAAQNAALQ